MKLLIILRPRPRHLRHRALKLIFLNFRLNLQQLKRRLAPRSPLKPNIPQTHLKPVPDYQLSFTTRLRRVVIHRLSAPWPCYFSLGFELGDDWAEEGFEFFEDGGVGAHFGEGFETVDVGHDFGAEVCYYLGY